MSLYNLKTADGQFRITKFTNDLDVESSYLLSESECACPAGSRPTCRHRQMLPKMLEVQAADSGLFYDFDSDKFFEPLGEGEPELTDVTSIIAEPESELEPYGKSPGLDEMLAESRADNERMKAKIIANESRFVEGLSQSLHATVNYMTDGSVRIDEAHPTIGHIKRRV